jgi:hypothetical protein
VSDEPLGGSPPVAFDDAVLDGLSVLSDEDDELLSLPDASLPLALSLSDAAPADGGGELGVLPALLFEA